MQLVSGGRWCPLEIQALAKSFEGAASRSHEVPAVYLRPRIEAVAQLADKGGARASAGSANAALRMSAALRFMA